MRTFDRFVVARGATGWVYRYWNQTPIERAGWVSGGLELSVQLQGTWLHAGRWRGRQRIERGDTFFINPSELYDHRYRAEAGRPGVQVGFLLSPEDPHGTEGELRLIAGPRRDARLVALARYVADAVLRRRPLDTTRVHATLIEFQNRHCEVLPWDPVLTAKRELDRHYYQPLYINQIAAQAGLHPAAFARKFVERFGVGPARYRLLLRINEAARLLWSEPARSHVEVAERVGFEDESFFYRAFRQVTSMTPSQYAGRVWSAGESPPRGSSK